MAVFEGGKVHLVDLQLAFHVLEILQLQLGGGRVRLVGDFPADLGEDRLLLRGQAVEEGVGGEQEGRRIDMPCEREVRGDLKVLLLVEAIGSRLGAVDHATLQGGEGLTPGHLLRCRTHLLEDPLAELPA